MLCRREDVPFNIISLNMFESIKQFYSLMWFEQKQLEAPFKGDNVKALIKRQIVKTWSFISLKMFRKLQYLLFFVGFQ